MHLTITGRPHSKKNSRRIFTRGRGIINLPSVAYEKWNQTATREIKEQTAGKTLVGELSLSVDVYIFGKNHVDLDNIITSVCDLLQDSGVIKDDDQITEITNCHKIGGCGGWSTKIVITELKGAF